MQCCKKVFVLQSDIQTLLLRQDHARMIPREHARKPVRGRCAGAVCPAAWQLLHNLGNNTWGILALLQLAKFFADSRKLPVVAMPMKMFLPHTPDDTSAVGLPANVTASEMQVLRPVSQKHAFEVASARSCVCSQPDQLLSALKEIAVNVLYSADTSAGAVKEMLDCTTQQISSQAVTALVSLLVSPDSQFRSAAEALLVRLQGGAQEAAQNSDALQKGIAVLLSTNCASFLISAYGEHLQTVEDFLQQNSQASLRQLCLGDSCSMHPVVDLAAPLLACSITDDGSMASRLKAIAISCWSISTAILNSMGLLECGTALSSQCEALLVAALRAIAIVWETHIKQHTLSSSHEKIQQSLGFIAMLLHMPRYFPNMTRTLSEVWISSLMTVTSDLPSPVPWSQDVHAAAVSFVSSDGNVPSFVRKHISGLLGSSAPGNMSKVAAGTAASLSDLPSTQKTDKNLKVIDLTENEDASPRRRHVTNKQANGNNSPLLKAWNATGAKKPSLEGSQTPAGLSGFSGGRTLGGSRMNFVRTGPNAGKKLDGLVHANSPMLRSNSIPQPASTTQRLMQVQQAAIAASTSHGAAPAASAPKPGTRRVTAQPGAVKRLTQRVKRLRDMLEQGDSDSDQFDDDEGKWTKKIRPVQSRPLQPGATHMKVSLTSKYPLKAGTTPFLFRALPVLHCATR
jgi:hypothetical protein